MRVLFLSVTVGAGHNTVAATMSDYFVKNGHTTETIDLFKNNKFISGIISGIGFRAMYTFPGLTNSIYMNYKKKNKSFYETAVEYARKYVLPKINDFKPDIIISSHVAGLLFTQKYRDFIANPFKNCFFVTDYEIPPSVFNDENKDYIIVPDDLFRNRLIERGFSAERVFAFGIPVNDKFFKKGNAEDIIWNRRLKSFDPLTKTIMFMGGAKGLGNIFSTVKYISENTKYQIIVVSGKNRKIKKKIDALKCPRIFSFGYVNYVDELMDISDILFGKTGGLSATEALAKGLKIVAYKKIPCPEYLNLVFLEERGLARAVNEKKELLTVLPGMEKSGRKLANPNVCADVYDILVN